MQSRKKYQRSYKSNLQIASLNFLRKAILPTILLCAFFLAIPDHIKAQITSIISEDGDGIIGVTSLMNATINDDVEATKFFAKSGASVVNQKNVGGATALHIAARRGNLEICKILVENGANVNITDNEGWTPLMRAAIAKNSELVKFLINNGADPKKMNLIGETVIINSASSGCSDCLEQILSSANFADNFNIDALKKQIEDALVVANNKNDLPTQSILKEYLASEVGKGKVYNIINNQNSEMPITPNNSRGDGIVVVKSLNNMSSSPVNQDVKKDYKFYKMEAAHPSKPALPASTKKIQTFGNIVNKTNQEVAQPQQPTDSIENFEKKVFIFKGNKKPSSPLIKTVKPFNSNVKPASQPENLASETHNISNDIIAPQPTSINPPVVQYKFTGQKKPFVKK